MRTDVILDRVDQAVNALNNNKQEFALEVLEGLRGRLRPVTVGDRVRIVDISPKYLSGLAGEIVAPGRRRSDWFVKLDHPQLARRYSNPLSVPASCLERE